jgi:hypothetical protein
MATTPEITAALKARLKELDDERRSITRFLGALFKKATKTATSSAAKATRKRRKMSAAAKKKISRMAKA